MTVIGGPILDALFGDAYAGSGEVLAVLVWAHVFAFVFVLSRQVLIGIGRAGELARLAWIAAAVNVALNLVLIPAHGALGAAVASLVAYAAPMLAAALGRDRNHPFTLAARALWRAALAAILLVGVTFVASELGGWLVALAVWALAVPVALLATGALRSADIREMRSAIAGRAP